MVQLMMAMMDVASTTMRNISTTVCSVSLVRIVNFL
jgi:hypothetical protein